MAALLDAEALDVFGRMRHRAVSCSAVDLVARVHRVGAIRQLEAAIASLSDVSWDPRGEDGQRHAVDRAEHAIHVLRRGLQGGGLVKAHEVAGAGFKAIERAAEQLHIAAPTTGYDELDSAVRGTFHTGTLLILIGARARKFLHRLLIANVTRRSVKSVLFAAGDLSSTGIQLLGTSSQIPGGRLREGRLSEREEWPRLARTAAQLSETELYVSTSLALSVLEMRAMLHQLRDATVRPIDVVGVEDLHGIRNIAFLAEEDRRRQVIRDLRGLAADLGVRVVLCGGDELQCEERDLVVDVDVLAEPGE